MKLDLGWGLLGPNRLGQLLQPKGKGERLTEFVETLVTKVEAAQLGPRAVWLLNI